MIQVTRSDMPSFVTYTKEIQSLWDSCWLTNNGEKARALEKALAERWSVPYVALFSNGHLALEAMLRTLQCKGEVITTPFTFVSTTHAIVRAGLTPVFCDVNEKDGTMNASKIEACITNKTCAILPVHVYGNVCDHEAIQAIAQNHHIPLLYDGAHTFDTQWKHQSVATLGNATMFSFHATKVFHTIEGGAIATKSKELYDALALERNFGIADYEDIPAIGGNAKMNEFQAAMGLCNLPNTAHNIQCRKAIWERYQNKLADLPSLRLPSLSKDVTANYSYFPIRFQAGFEAREKAFVALAKRDIHARKYFYPLITDLSCYANTYDANKTPVAKAWANSVLTLPLYPTLTEDQVDEICHALHAIIKE